MAMPADYLRVLIVRSQALKLASFIGPVGSAAMVSGFEPPRGKLCGVAPAATLAGLSADTPSADTPGRRLAERLNWMTSTLGG